MTRRELSGGVLVASLWVAAVGCSGGRSGGGFAASTAATAPASSTPAAVSPAAVSPAASSSTTAPGSTAAAPAPTYGTRHCWPIVLVHGFSGFRNLGPLEYWFGIPEVLRAHGFEVLVVEDHPYDTVEERANELKRQVLAAYPDPRVKVNLIGHSMGGLDSRYAVSKLGMGDKVVSVTTIGTPHRGSSVADVIFGLIPGPLQSVLNALIGIFGQNITGGGKELTTVYCDQVFNPGTPDDPRVHYFSWTGHADPTGSRTGCIIQPFLLISWMILDGVEGDNDGLVSVKSAQWGDFQGVVPADHMQEVGQLLGITAPGFDHEQFYETWAEQLEARGYGP